MSDRIPFRVRPMLATLVREPFDRPGWVFEEKYDGYRILAYKEAARVTLLSRNGKDRTQTFAAVAQAVKRLPSRTLLLDGEVVAFDRRGVSRFQLLQNLQSPPSYAVFDCLYEDGKDLRSQPLTDRRAALEDVVDATDRKRGTIFLSARLSADGLKAYQAAKQKGYEGVVAKDASSPYVEGRSRYWLKFKVHQEDEFVIVGYTPPAGSRKHFGALLLGAYDHGKLDLRRQSRHRFHPGDAGATLQEISAAGSRQASRRRSAARAQCHLARAPAWSHKSPMENGPTIANSASPSFSGLRDDKRPEDVALPEAK